MRSVLLPTARAGAFCMRTAGCQQGARTRGGGARRPRRRRAPAASACCRHCAVRLQPRGGEVSSACTHRCAPAHARPWIHLCCKLASARPCGAAGGWGTRAQRSCPDGGGRGGKGASRPQPLTAPTAAAAAAARNLSWRPRALLAREARSPGRVSRRMRRHMRPVTARARITAREPAAAGCSPHSGTVAQHSSLFSRSKATPSL